MNFQHLRPVISVLLFLGFTASSATFYVDLNSPGPLAPYSDWSTAATNIQDAVDASSNGDVILVNDGLYQAGQRLATGTSTSNRLTITKAVTVQSVNGPSATIIKGFQTATTNGTGAIRCVYLTNNAVLSGFTLTNGATVAVNTGGGAWCWSSNCLVTNCVIVGNSAAYGGAGVESGTLVNCSLFNNALPFNLSFYGGGAENSVLRYCNVFSNVAGAGGGAATCSLLNCRVTGNLALAGGGVYSCNATNCVIAGNRAVPVGSSGGGGGGSFASALVNCTVTGNSAALAGGSDGDLLLSNCIVYFNKDSYPFGNTSNYFVPASVGYSCSVPLAAGTGNIQADPRLIDVAHLGPGSPCIGAGHSSPGFGTDIDGEAWAAPRSIGCDEYSTAAAGPLSIAIQTANTNLLVGYSEPFVPVISGWASSTMWDFGDGTVVSNRAYASHAWAAPGDFQVTLWASNASNPTGVISTVAVHVPSQAVLYVAVSNPTPVAPYTTWGTAATAIQDAVDAVVMPGSVIYVTNGTYQSGGTIVFGSLSNRVAVNKPITVQSVNGPSTTVIQGNPVVGNNAIRCVYLTNGAALMGFTLTNGATRSSGDAIRERSGGAIWCESTNAMVSNCVIVASAAHNAGGGAYLGTFMNCTLSKNAATNYGGGAFLSTLTNCLVTDNSVIGSGLIGSGGGGVTKGIARGCVITNNIAPLGGGALSNILVDCLVISNRVGSYGGGAAFCAVTNCTLWGNAAYNGGGGSYSGTLSRSILVANTWTSFGTSSGGGSFGDTMNNCLLYLNSAATAGGAYNSTMNQCTVVSNSASTSPDGTFQCRITNSIIYLNGLTDDQFSSMNYCCSRTPFPGCFNKNPLFADAVFHLQSNSPCINAANNLYTTVSNDIDGNPRIVAGTVDVGACEYQTPTSILSYLWAQQYHLSTDGSADFADPDGDGMNNWQEWKAVTTPTNSLSVLKILSATNVPSGIAVTWQSVSAVTYYLQQSTNLSGGFLTVKSNIAGKVTSTTSTNTAANNNGPYFYRIGVQ